LPCFEHDLCCHFHTRKDIEHIFKFTVHSPCTLFLQVFYWASSTFAFIYFPF
jgi:hypothetical protein